MKITFLNPLTNEKIKTFKSDKLEDLYEEISKEIFLSFIVYGEYKIKCDYGIYR